jgi:hypothetical protein
VVYKQVKGTLTVLQAATVDGCEEFYDFDGRDIKFPSVQQADATPKGGVISLAIDSNGNVSPDKPWWIPVQEPDQAATWEGRRVIKVGLFKVVRDLDDYDEDLRKVTALAQQSQNFWRKQAGRKWDLTIYPYVLPLVEGDEMPDRGRWCEKSIAALKVANPDDETLHSLNYFHLWGNMSSNYCGWGQRPGKYSMTFASCGPRTVCHELGHNFGLPHSNSMDLETGNSREYGDTDCVMGRSYKLLNAPHRAALKLDTQEEIMLLNKSRRFLLSQVLTEPEDLHENMFNHVQLANGGRTYSLSTQGHGNKLIIHLMGNRDNSWKPHRIQQVNVGGEFVLEDLWTIKVEAFDRGYLLVSVDFGDDVPLQDIEIPQTLPQAYSSSRPSEAHQGIWWVPELSGQGFDIQIDPEGSQGVLTWYTYNNKRANLQNFYSQRWFTGSFKSTDTDFVLESYNENKVMVPIGEAQLNFLDADNGLLRYRVFDTNGSVPITRLTWGQSARQGLYYSDEGQQLSVHYFGPKLVAFVTGFCDVPLDYIGRPVKGAITNQEWMLLVGDAKPVTTQVTVTGGNDGKFMEMIVPDLEQKGLGQLVYNEGGTWTFKYDGFEYHFE